MFHQVQVKDEDRDFLKFLWWPDGDLNQKLTDYQMNVHLFGAVSSPSVANFAVHKTAEIADGRGHHETADILRRNFYVDDCLRSESTEAHAIQSIQDTASACKDGGFNLTKFTSNNRNVLQTITREKRSKDVKDIDLCLDDLPVERALGVQWHIETDTFGFKITLKDKPLTRRGILSTVSSVYDPLGFAAPLMLPGKRILQELCKADVDWDDLIPDEYVYRWERWRSKLFKLESLSIDRCLKPTSFGTVVDCQIHNFSDASSIGYGHVSYLRQVDDQGKIHCAFLMGKARVAPLKPITIPRLELTAATTSAKLGTKIAQELDLTSSSTFWTDSTTVIKYITNEQNRYHTYVANRVETIRSLSSPSQWKFVPGKINPADDASRGLDNVEDTYRWILGPEFLWEPTVNWPVPAPDINQDSKDPEVKSVYSTEVKENRSSIVEAFNRFSNWSRLKRVVARILRLSKSSSRGPITVTELESAEVRIIRAVQSMVYGEEISMLMDKNEDKHPNSKASAKAKKNKLKRSSPLWKLDPFIDDQQLLRVGGRLNKADGLDENMKNPIILPKKHHVTNLIVKEAHESVAHGGRGMTLNRIRQKFWIINANAVVRSLIFKCVSCRKMRGVVSDQKMADLPKCRVSTEPPFTYCGIDFFGPFVIKEGRKEIKRYGVVFTCMSSRAVHLEIASSLETDTFINALRRFVARRGPVRELYTDRGTNLMGAEKELKQALLEQDVTTLQERLPVMFGCDVIWKRNPPAASHMGGSWERQIRTIRAILRSLMKDFGHSVNDESLRTLFTEVECIVNSRPLTFPSSDPQDLNPLTPNHILTMKSRVVLPPPGEFLRDDVYLKKRWRRVQYLVNVFWSRWKKEYIQSLQQRSKWNNVKRNLRVGDVVLIKQENTARNVWPLARIVEVYPDAKGFVRSVKLRTATTTLDRPISKLVLILEN